MVKLYNNLKAVVVSMAVVSLIGLSGCQSTSYNKNDRTKQSIKVELDTMLGDVQTLKILPNRVPCNSQLPMQCLLVTVEEGTSKASFQLPYDAIEGFKAKPNTTYKISARPLIHKVDKQKTGRWKLESILSLYLNNKSNS